MNIVTTTLTTEAHFSEDGAKRYLLRKVWDESKPKLAIVMLAPSAASGIALDNTTLLVLNNADRLGYGSVEIVNLFSYLNDFTLKHTQEDPENLEVIVQTAQNADTIVYAPGVGKAANKAFQERQKQVLTALEPFQDKLHCLSNDKGTARLQHPLSPAVRLWKISPLAISELLPEADIPTPAPEQKKKAKKASK